MAPAYVSASFLAGLLAILPNAATGADFPIPTPSQIKYQHDEIMALIHFNMATFSKDGDLSCSAENWNVKAPYATGKTSDPATFNPIKLNVSNWVESMKDIGAKHSVLTAKHECGFLLWPSKTKLPDGSEYTYGVGKEGSAIKYDVLHEYSKTLEANGIGHGFYYSFPKNFYLNVDKMKVLNRSLLPGQIKVTQDEFEAIAFSHLEELWSNYGALSEIWFDGGYTHDLRKKIAKLVKEKQPDAAAFGGYGVSDHPVCWVGTESGAPPGDVWSTGGDGLGEPDSKIYCPKACDTTLQEGDHWFFIGNPIRSLKELIDVYHKTVGRNGMLELDFGINRDGLVEPSHAARYKEFGDWIRKCYSAPIAETAGSETLIELHLPENSPPIDRVMIREDLTKGQRVRDFQVEYQSDDEAGKWKTFSEGHSIGNKRIDIAAEGGSWKKFRLRILKHVGDKPYISKFAVFQSCSNGANFAGSPDIITT
eukprot:TRINITY_DN13443_c0_g2_i1.p1 TRINITY_DN13443_c0_g2~~TRINITY_DN13443_c0_g2_i1.p1  ORF type:complete len:486 (+),score=82.37 TRINITY_DN13443_c0_g2_i1:23-1459(+)